MLEGNLYQVLTREEGNATVRFLPESPVYAAHFPGFPITPGVTLVQTALELMGRRLRAAKDIKFLKPVFPGATVRVEWTVEEDDAAQVMLYGSDGEPCARMLMSV